MRYENITCFLSIDPLVAGIEGLSPHTGCTAAESKLKEGEMSVDERSEKAIEIIEGQVKELEEIVYTSAREFDLALEKLTRWKSRTVKLLSKNVNPGEAKKLAKIGAGLVSSNQIELFRFKKEKYRAFLEALAGELEFNPEDTLSVSRAANAGEADLLQAPKSASKKALFIIHGHDETNLLRLEKLLKERWKLVPIVLKFKAGKTRTLIEKFEDEAQNASYAMALITPDDLVRVDDTEYIQARPNSVFELGWFCGRLGRSKLCILVKEGTKIHSDLDGINTIRFHDSVEEKIPDIERELKAAGLVGD